MKNHTAVFIGHSECFSLQIKDLDNAIIQLINNGVTGFLSGGQGGFDRLCAVRVHELKAWYPQIKNYLVIPYLTFGVFIDEIFDEIIYPEGFEKYYFKAAIPARNNYMVDHSAYAICYIRHSWGGAAVTYKRAIQKNLQIINLGERIQ